MEKFLKLIFDLGPMIFAIGFLTPLIREIVTRAGLIPPFGLKPLIFSLVIASAYGLVAQIRGRWI